MKVKCLDISCNNNVARTCTNPDLEIDVFGICCCAEWRRKR